MHDSVYIFTHRNPNVLGENRALHLNVSWQEGLRLDAMDREDAKAERRSWELRCRLSGACWEAMEDGQRRRETQDGKGRTRAGRQGSAAGHRVSGPK